jgi:FemAB-related protein (PEP-CTERM system-associated)
MPISLSHNIEWQLWDAFVKAHPFGSPFHLSNWQKIIQSTFGHKPLHIMAADPKGEVVGVLPLFLVRSRLFGRMLVSTPQAAYGGILASSESITNQILMRAQEIARELNVEFLELRGFRNSIQSEELLQKDLYVHFARTFRQILKPTCWPFHEKRAQKSVKVLKHGLEFKVGAIGTREFFNVYSHSVHNLGTPVFPRSLFQMDLRNSVRTVRFFSVHWKDKLVAAVWTLFYKDEVVPYFGGPYVNTIDWQPIISCIGC